MDALVKWSGFSPAKIRELLKFGKGPTVKIMDLRSSRGPKIYGHCRCPGVPETAVEIEVAFVRGLEQANLKSTKQATAFLLSVVLLHEFVHYGTYTNNINEYLIEFGEQFEKQAFRVVIGKGNAGQYYYDFMQN
ncbi:hypothetical protein [Larkinella soli]|uniref:hypothetical protein n=1 Tax=Larkinella soli TaxID=1770527 RepID=UPI000FFC9AC0|nr:hypothetical protein [Larkinella soli]